MKTVLLVFPGIRLSNNGGAKQRLLSFISSYASAGCKVYVLAFCKLSNGKVQLPKTATWIKFPYLLPSTRHIALTLFQEYYMKLVVGLVTWFLQPDMVQFEQYGLRSSLCHNRPEYIVDWHGDLYHEYIESGRGTLDSWYARHVLELQRNTVANIDFHIVVSEHLKQQIEVNTKDTINRYGVISCGVDLERFNVNQATVPFELDNRIVLGYCGGLQRWQNVDDIIKIVIRLHELDDRVFFFLFTADDVSTIEPLLQELGQKNYCIKSLSHNEVPSYLKLLDAGFLVRDNLILNIVSSPTKIGEYLAAGAGLICTRYSGDYASVTRNSQSCFVLNDQCSNIDELYQWLLTRKQSIRDNSFLEKFTFDNQFKGFIQQRTSGK